MNDQLRSGWTTMPLRNVGVWTGGGTPSKADPRFWTGGTVPWVSPKDMKIPVLHGSEDYITDVAVSESATRMVASGSVLVVTRSGILERTLPLAVNAVPVALNQDIKAITPVDGVDVRFLYWLLVWRGDEILRTCTKAGTTVASVETSRLHDLEVPVAPLAEQRRIVAALEEHLSDLDAAVAALERARANLRRLRAATTRAAVDGSLLSDSGSNDATQGPDPWAPAVPPLWTWATVEDVAEVVEYGTSAKTREDAEGIPVLRMGNIVDGSLSWENLKYLPASHDEFPRLMLRAGDVLFNRTNSPELVGKTAVYRAGSRPASFASYLLRVRLTPQLHPEFFSAYVSSVYGRAWVATVVSQQVGQANVNGTKLRALRVPLPPADEQLALVTEMERRLAASERAAADIDIQLARAARLRQSILERAFSGRLVAQDPNDEPAPALLPRLPSSPAPSARSSARGRSTRTRA